MRLAWPACSTGQARASREASWPGYAQSTRRPTDLGSPDLTRADVRRVDFPVIAAWQCWTSLASSRSGVVRPPQGRSPGIMVPADDLSASRLLMCDLLRPIREERETNCARSTRGAPPGEVGVVGGGG